MTKRHDPLSAESRADVAMIEAGTQKERHNLSKALTAYCERINKVTGHDANQAIATAMSTLWGLQIELADAVMPEHVKAAWVEQMAGFVVVLKDVVEKHPSMPLIAANRKASQIEIKRLMEAREKDDAA